MTQKLNIATMIIMLTIILKVKYVDIKFEISVGLVSVNISIMSCPNTFPNL